MEDLVIDPDSEFKLMASCVTFFVRVFYFNNLYHGFIGWLP